MTDRGRLNSIFSGETDISRRRVLQVGAAGVAGVTGCIGGGDDTNDETGNTGDDSNSPQETGSGGNDNKGSSDGSNSDVLSHLEPVEVDNWYETIPAGETIIGEPLGGIVKHEPEEIHEKIRNHAQEYDVPSVPEQLFDNIEEAMSDKLPLLGNPKYEEIEERVYIKHGERGHGAYDAILGLNPEQVLEASENNGLTTEETYREFEIRENDEYAVGANPGIVLISNRLPSDTGDKHKEILRTGIDTLHGENENITEGNQHVETLLEELGEGQVIGTSHYGQESEYEGEKLEMESGNSGTGKSVTLYETREAEPRRFRVRNPDGINSGVEEVDLGEFNSYCTPQNLLNIHDE
jgi:hypothetical protein